MDESAIDYRLRLLEFALHVRRWIRTDPHLTDREKYELRQMITRMLDE